METLAEEDKGQIQVIDMKTRRIAARQQAQEYMNAQDAVKEEEPLPGWAQEKARKALHASDIRANFGELFHCRSCATVAL